MKRLLAVALVALLVGGCALPGWVPVLGKKDPGGKSAKTAKAAKSTSKTGRKVVAEPGPDPEADQKPAEATPARPPGEDVTDRIVAVVNNDAITLAELQENILLYRQESRSRAGVSDEELGKQFLARLIDTRLQLQEAEREKVVVDEGEIDDELQQRMKRFGATTMAQFEEMVKGQGLQIEQVRKRVRETLRVAKVVRRKVALRVSVTDAEVDRYLTENREKLETGLSYHVRHILIAPVGRSDAEWEAARIRADMIRTQILDGADFGDLAREYSKDASARSGGDLGTLKRGELAPEIEAQILALKEGELSRPYRSPLGYHLFRLESKEILEGEGLQRARQQVRDILFRQKYEARLDAWLKEIKQRAVIEVRL